MVFNQFKRLFCVFLGFGVTTVEKRAPEWVTVDSVVYATWSKIMDPRSRTIPKKAMECALANLERANLVDP